jgi:hypothetical protein
MGVEIAGLAFKALRVCTIVRVDPRDEAAVRLSEPAVERSN